VFSIELKVPPEVEFGSLVQSVVGDAARRAELPDDRRTALESAAALGFTIIVRQAMAESREPIRIVAACTPAHLTVSLFERGLPLDDAAERRDPNWNAIAAEVDEAHWHSHGSAGSELRLLVERPHGLQEYSESTALEEDVPEAPAQTYDVRRFEPADAPGVVRAFYLAYGYNYDLPAVYVPSRLIELNRTGRYVSTVAVAQDGEIVGHYALSRENGEPIADGGGAIVLPAHRGRNLATLLRAHAEREAIAMGLEAYCSEPVTDHGRTQHMSESFGAVACGITLGGSPRTFLAKHMELSTTTQRQSFMLYVKRLQQRERRRIFAPERHRAIVARIYEQLDLPADFAQAEPPAGPGALRTAIFRADGVGFVTVEQAGAQAADLVRQAIDDLRTARHLGAIYLSLSLEDPGTPALCEAMESHGFYFSAVAPWMHGGKDALRLQMPLTPIDLSSLTVVGAFGKELLSYIEAERRRCALAAT